MPQTFALHKPKTTTMRDCISAEKQLAVTLYYLMDEGRLSSKCVWHS